MLKQCTASGLAALEQDLTSSGGAPGTSACAASTSGKGASAPASATTPGGTIGGGLGWSRDRVLQRFPLLYPALEGLARYTHLVSVEYFNDLMEVFKQVGRGVGSAKGCCRGLHLVSVEYFNHLMEVLKQVGRGVGRCEWGCGEVQRDLNAIHRLHFKRAAAVPNAAACGAPVASSTNPHSHATLCLRPYA